MATAARTANLFECRCDGIRITYSTSGLAGREQLSYSGPEGALSFAGPEVRSQSSALGSEVTVTLETVPDFRTTDFTLLLPTIALGHEDEVPFETIAIRTTTSTTLGGPPAGAAQTYEPVAMHGVAKAVGF